MSTSSTAWPPRRRQHRRGRPPDGGQLRSGLADTAGCWRAVDYVTLSSYRIFVSHGDDTGGLIGMGEIKVLGWPTRSAATSSSPDRVCSRVLRTSDRGVRGDLHSVLATSHPNGGWGLRGGRAAPGGRQARAPHRLRAPRGTGGRQFARRDPRGTRRPPRGHDGVQRRLLRGFLLDPDAKAPEAVRPRRCAATRLVGDHLWIRVADVSGIGASTRSSRPRRGRGWAPTAPRALVRAARRPFSVWPGEPTEHVDRAHASEGRPGRAIPGWQRSSARRMAAQSQKATDFRALHEGETFVIPNPWDAGSAKVLEALGFKALATTSSGFAFTLGRLDGSVTLDEIVDHTRALDQATGAAGLGRPRERLRPRSRARGAPRSPRGRRREPSAARSRTTTRAASCTRSTTPSSGSPPPSRRRAA